MDETMPLLCISLGVEVIIIQLFWHHYNTNRAASIILSTRIYCISRIISAGRPAAGPRSGHVLNFSVHAQ